jgi:glycyl-tRNA synthetase
MEYFVRPGEDEAAHQSGSTLPRLVTTLGIAADNLRLYEQPKEELAHYASARLMCSIVSFLSGLTKKSSGRIDGYRQSHDFDLRTHSKSPGPGRKRLNPDSTEDLSYFDEATKERFILT